MVQVLVLGPLQVTVSKQIVELSRGRQRLLLAALALAGGEIVSTDRLVDAVWDGDPPDSAVATLQVHLSNLRAALRAAGTEELIVTRSPGYALADGDVVDAVRFERQAAEGRAALRAGRTADAATMLRDALARWRGTVLPDIDADFVRPHRARLEELRRVALEERVEADLLLGRHVEVAAWLPSVVRERPHQERLHGQLVLALYRGGRQADALRACHELRRALVEDLGLDPSPELRRLERAVLEQDTSLDWVPPAEPAGSGLVGRRAELAAIGAELAAPGIVMLVGSGGVGKTRLAVEVAHGAPIVELGSVTAGVLGTIATTLAVIEQPTRSLLDSVASALPPLVVIDNCEHVLAEVRGLVVDLVPLAPACTLLLTSREPLGLEAERILEITPLDEASAIELFLDRARSVRPSITVSAAVKGICELVEGLPLAIELAAARTDLLDPEQVAARLNDSLSLLTGGPATAPARHRTLRAALEWGHALLSPSEQTLFRRLAVLPGAWALEDAEDVVGESAVDTLAGLVRASLVVVDTTGGSTRFRLAMPVRQLATELLDAAGETDEIYSRLLAAMLHRSPDHSYEGMRAALAWALERGGDPAGGLALCQRLVDHWFVRGALSEGRAWCDAAFAHAGPGLEVSALRLGAGNLSQAAGDFEAAARHFESASTSSDARVRARASFGLANLAHLTGQADALEHLEASANAARQLGDDDLLMRSLNGLGVAARRAGDFERARVAGDDALRAARRLGDRISTITSLVNLGNLLQVIGRRDDARARLEEALLLAREDGFARGMAGALGSLAALATDPAEARARFEESLEVARAAGDRPVMAATMANLAVLQAREGDTSTARATFEEYRAVCEQMGDPRGVAFAAQALAELAWRADDAPAAGRLVREALELRAELGDDDRLAECLELAGLLLARGDLAEVATIALASADASRTRIGVPRDPDAARVWESALDATRTELAGDRFAAAWSTGAALAPVDAARVVLARC